MNEWTTPDTLATRLLRDWEKGRLLSTLVTGEALFPMRIPLKAPTSTELRDRFADVRTWIGQLQAAASSGDSAAYRLEMRRIEHRVIGANEVPVAIWIDSLEHAVAFIHKNFEAEQFRTLLAMTRERCPTLLDWVGRRPLRALEVAQVWHHFLDIVLWLKANPRPAIYLRQIDLPGVHTKLIEQHRGVLTELLELALPPDAIVHRASGGLSFERRFGFLEKPSRVRFRVLGGSRALPTGLTDLTLTSEEFARFDPGAARVFVTENEVNYLAFPLLPDALVIFGAGYGFEALRQAGWLRRKAIYYWGDLDTHGFAILDQLRADFPDACSILMDAATLMTHRNYWGREESPTKRQLERLTPDEADVYDDLRYDRLGNAVRLEQEKVRYSRVLEVLTAI